MLLRISPACCPGLWYHRFPVSWFYFFYGRGEGAQTRRSTSFLSRDACWNVSRVRTCVMLHLYWTKTTICKNLPACGTNTPHLSLWAGKVRQHSILHSSVSHGFMIHISPKRYVQTSTLYRPGDLSLFDRGWTRRHHCCFAEPLRSHCQFVQ